MFQLLTQRAHRHPCTHRTAQGHHTGNRRTTTTTQSKTSSRAVARAVTHATQISRTCGCISTIHPRTPCPTPVPATLPANGRTPTTRKAAHLTGDLRTGGRTTRGPLRGRLPPPPRGAVGVRGGVVPRPSTPSCGGTSNCRNECTSHSPASSSPAAGVEKLRAHALWPRNFSTPAAFHEDAGP